MFSDILTPLPSMGIEFDVIKGSGPLIPTPIRSMDQVRISDRRILGIRMCMQPPLLILLCSCALCGAGHHILPDPRQQKLRSPWETPWILDSETRYGCFQLPMSSGLSTFSPLKS